MPSSPETSSGLYTGRPQSLLLTLLGAYFLDGKHAIYSGSVIDVFARVGVSEVAVRSTLTRMVSRQLLVRHRRGRKTYLGLTAHALEVLRDGYRRIWESSTVNRDWDGTWTLIGFSLPDNRRAERHLLRSTLTWEGFGPLQNGLWIAAGARDASAVVQPLGLLGDIIAMSATTIAPTAAEDLVRRAFNTAEIAARYRDFLALWDTPRPIPAAPDDLTRQLLLQAGWLQLIRQDPRLPVAHLPKDWPAIRAEKVFHRLAGTLAESARPIAEELFDVIDVGLPA